MDPNQSNETDTSSIKETSNCYSEDVLLKKITKFIKYLLIYIKNKIINR